jgi:hypothetical protein
MSGLRDYEVRSDKFELEQGGHNCDGLSFPCTECMYRYGLSTDKPCNKCGHNLTADLDPEEVTE